MAIITKDPVTIAGYTIPQEFQWFGSPLLTAFGVWKFYLNPLKLKVYTMDRELGEVKTALHRLESDVSLLLNRSIKK